jgi:uridine kinase
MDTVRVQLPSGNVRDFDYGTRVETVIRMDDRGKSDYPIIAAIVNDVVVSLSFKVEVDARIEAVTLDSDYGARIYRRSLSFLLTMASREIFPERRLVIGHALGEGYYYYYDSGVVPDERDLKLLNGRMREIVDENRPIIRRSVGYLTAIEYFKGTTEEATLLLLEQRNDPKIPLYCCGKVRTLSYEPLVPSTSLLSVFDLTRYPPGFLLRYPSRTTPEELSEFRENRVLFSIFQEHKKWGNILDVDCVGKLNRISGTEEIREFIRVSEALHDKNISQIADSIAEHSQDVKIVLIAGPSSSGKTTFTKKLAIQLKVDGLEPAVISLDDYFVPRELTPRDERGEYDFESIDAIDIRLLNEHLNILLDGGEIEVPAFDFKTGSRKRSGRVLTLAESGILLMEGIHGLNPRLTEEVARENKYLVYISALTQLNLDDHNRISTTDNRLVRRMVRDYQFRGHSARDTFKMWPSVRRGEERNIFPYQNNADSALNSALDYELAVLKVYAEPLLRTVKPGESEYAEATRLQAFLTNFASIPDRHVPSESILREFIGGSSFRY